MALVPGSSLRAVRGDREGVSAAPVSIFLGPALDRPANSRFLQNLDDLFVAPQNLVDKYSTKCSRSLVARIFQMICRRYGDGAQVHRRGHVLAQQTRLHSGAAGPCFGLCSQAMHAMDAAVPTAFGRFRRPNAKKAPGASTRTSLHGSEEPPDTFSAGCPEGLPTAVSSPKAWTCGRALAGVPASPRPRRSVSWLPVRRPAYPKIRAPLPGCRFPRRFPGCRPRRPKPPGRSAFDPVPRVRLSGSSASRPKASTASATCFLAVTSRVNE